MVLEVIFNKTRNINLRFTYLLTYSMQEICRHSQQMDNF